MAVAYLPVLVVLLVEGRFDLRATALCAGARLLSSVVPYATDVVVLRHLPPAVFGIVSSLNPVLAAVSGLALLGQHLTPSQWIALLVIVAANFMAVTSPTGARESNDEDHEMAWS